MQLQMGSVVVSTAVVGVPPTRLRQEQEKQPTGVVQGKSPFVFSACIGTMKPLTAWSPGFSRSEPSSRLKAGLQTNQGSWRVAERSSFQPGLRRETGKNCGPRWGSAPKPRLKNAWQFGGG